jgi:protein tyrosine/serine phosphatase
LASLKPYAIVAFLCLPATAVFAGTTGADGIPNFHKVDDHVYRGAQPVGQGWKTLADLGVRTVVDLRREGEHGHSTKAEARAVEAAGMHYINIPLGGMGAPPDADIRRILTISGSKEPVFVHCHYGKDRTGTAVACYRISHDNWSNARALQEAHEIGIHWFEASMKNFIMGFHPGVSLHSGEAQAQAGLTLVPALAAVQP